ncbi:MAG: aminotransferase class I/II-fold pyridoxal phosphate-dependent enzyme [Candidatus Bathyarchaeota archaeon]|nr:aminotransferase class I/II-fold pyridoxal phosphate-dependent enzyme [Candidatus Bathyarchaeota archaeon]
MKVDEFLVERWMNEYEHNVEINMAETCVEPFTLREFLEFTGRTDFFDEFQNRQLTYGFIEGNPELREGIANQYVDVDPNNVLVTGGAIEANFNAFYSLVEPGDTVISVFPAYQQLFSVAKSFGADVKRLHLVPENQWLPEIEELKELVDSKTKMIVLNNPHNPTGSLIDEALLRAICEVAEDSGAYVLGDEAYRGLYIHEGDHTPSVMDIYEKGIATGSFSKSISLTGLRLGWITSNGKVIHQCKLHRDYTTISKSMLDEALATIAIQHIDKIMERNLKIVRENHRFLDDWINDESLIEWVKPRAGSVAFMRHHLDMSSTEICKRLIEEKSTFMVPSDCFEVEGHLRIGYGNRIEVISEGLGRVKEFLDEHR